MNSRDLYQLFHDWTEFNDEMADAHLIISGDEVKIKMSVGYIKFATKQRFVEYVRADMQHIRDYADKVLDRCDNFLGELK